MLDLFKQYLFALISSGNFAPDLFIFTIYFIGFIKLNRYYDKNNGITPVDYGKLYLFRFLRIFPLYYFVFFAGWFILPLISNSANWYVTERLFMGCENQWPFVLLFLNNLIPFFTKALEGCFYWPYVIPNDMLLYSLFPLWIIIYRFNKIAFYILNSFILVGGIFIVGFITYQYDLTVGILTLEDYYLYAYQFNKPYTKFVGVSLGMFLAIFYMRLLKYREANNVQKRTEFSWIHFMKGSKIITVLFAIYGMGMLMFITAVPLTANGNGYLWTKAQNIAYYSLGRLAYISSVMAFLVIIFLGNFGLFKRLLGQPLWVPFSKLCFGAYLLYPIGK